ncbi:hypothetical protein [uncultured Sphingomonas sp.]|uniref:hypothetical protein n=1 Tax=uncultured Sphingomonas sp. TaxID=158754 RepID=UPI0035CA49FA
MRIAVALAVTMLNMAASAMAAEPSVPFADTVASAVAQGAVSVVPVVEARFGPAIGGRFEKPMTLVADQFTSEGIALRHRFASSMMEFYPLANSGFHFSGGLRFFGVTNFAREADKLTNNLLWSPGNRSSGGVRYGFKRQTPAMTFGYTKTVANKVAFGVEGGTLLGRVNASMPRSFERRLGGGRDDNRMNPVANLVFGVKF